ncbi:hypothetical protein EVAR_73094_1 [Eumeta japonica]|uniref:Neurofibromin n=1 Tax=Eumeta variegata TaxID=151549 RepID=A0A4C1SA94_EUMVA|nr:hypothetical protein EVAR_73094_1 [Eumeta japonica]
MGVKVDGIASDGNSEVKLTTLAERLDILQSSSNQLKGKELVAFCTNIIEWLAHAPIPLDEEGSWTTADRTFTVIEAYLHRTVEYLDKDSRAELISALLSKFSTVISEPKSTVSPAIAVVLFIFGGQCEKAVENTVRAFVQQLESQGSGHAQALAASLNHFYSWLSVFQYRNAWRYQAEIHIKVYCLSEL